MKYIQKYYEKHGDNILIILYKTLFLRGYSKKLKWLKLCGMKAGEGSIVTSSINNFHEPYMVSLGKNVYVASNVFFLTHDGAYSWITRKIGLTDKRTEKMGAINIGDNCFIGFGSTIMQNVTIGNNCIIAAGSVVTKNFPDNCVIGGTPAKVICSVEDYIERNKHFNDYTCGWSIYDKRKYYEKKFSCSDK